VTPPDTVAALEASLRRRFRVAQTEVSVGGRHLSLLHPASAEELISEDDFARDERLPYWAELWPSARVLGDRIGAMHGGGRTLLELGCGSGLVTTCAALAGFETTASDYYEDAVRFARVNARRNGAPDVHGAVLDWRDLPPRRPAYDVVVASDVLYERPYGALVARTIDAFLAPTGTAHLADPGRVGREAFLGALDDLALRVAERQDVDFEEAGIRQTIAIFTVRRTG
jgi:predicted nicotinamide N-methyase